MPPALLWLALRRRNSTFEPDPTQLAAGPRAFDPVGGQLGAAATGAGSDAVDRLGRHSGLKEKNTVHFAQVEVALAGAALVPGGPGFFAVLVGELFGDVAFDLVAAPADGGAQGRLDRGGFDLEEFREEFEALSRELEPDPLLRRP